MKNKTPHITEIIKTILDVEPDLKILFIFGSRAEKRKTHGHSDIDIGIVGMKKLDFHQLQRIEEAVDKIDMLYSVDIVDFTDRDDEFTEEALKNIEVIYEKTSDS